MQSPSRQPSHHLTTCQLVCVSGLTLTCSMLVGLVEVLGFFPISLGMLTSQSFSMTESGCHASEDLKYLVVVGGFDACDRTSGQQATTPLVLRFRRKRKQKRKILFSYKSRDAVMSPNKHASNSRDANFVPPPFPGENSCHQLFHCSQAWAFNKSLSGIFQAFTFCCLNS